MISLEVKQKATCGYCNGIYYIEKIIYTSPCGPNLQSFGISWLLLDCRGLAEVRRVKSPFGLRGMLFSLDTLWAFRMREITGFLDKNYCTHFTWKILLED